jgi:hypothetical protein
MKNFILILLTFIRANTLARYIRGKLLALRHVATLQLPEGAKKGTALHLQQQGIHQRSGFGLA